MSRSQRLFHLLQILRNHRGPVSGEVLGREAGVSLRTIRRDICTLQAMGADIDGAPGFGYVLRPGFLLPPLSLNEEELQALTAGAQWVNRQTDVALGRAAQNALAKIVSVLSPEVQRTLNDNALYIGRALSDTHTFDLGDVRKAMREQRKIQMSYKDEGESVSNRVVWPITLGFVEGQRYIAGWCELRNNFRLFRVDRTIDAAVLTDRYTRSRHQLVKEWRAEEDHRRRLASERRS